MRPAPPVPPPPGVDRWSALLAYEGEARELLARLKYRNDRTALGWLADGMASLVHARPDVVTWAPTSGVRARRRGFDQAELLARAVARRLGAPCAPLLRRAPGPAQTGRTAAARRAGPPRFAAARRAATGSVLLVDDVATTGATLTSAARALKAGGAREVYGLVAGRTTTAKRTESDR